jgi:hypothetical protein
LVVLPPKRNCEKKSSNNETDKRGLWKSCCDTPINGQGESQSAEQESQRAEQANRELYELKQKMLSLGISLD